MTEYQTLIKKRQGRIQHPEPLRSSVTSAEDEARQAFVEYHRAITNKDYNATYATLTLEQKQRVYNFNSYSAGYLNTLSNEVSNLPTVKTSDDSVTFDHRLTAHDKISGTRVKVQVFDGQVTSVKIDEKEVHHDLSKLQRKTA